MAYDLETCFSTQESKNYSWRWKEEQGWDRFFPLIFAGRFAAVSGGLNHARVCLMDSR